MNDMTQPAVFLDRDDTLVIDSGFIDHPDKVKLVPGAIEAVRRLRDAGYKVVVASNQSGVARGLFDEPRLAAIHDRLQSLLGEGDARLDGIYHCPYLEGPQAVVDAFRQKSDLRKPAPGMLRKAARDMDLDLARSWMIGDSARDIQAGQAAGCRTILLARSPASANVNGVTPGFVVSSLLEAVRIVEEQDQQTQSSVDDKSKPSDDRLAGLLTEIRDLLDRREREKIHDDFSVWRLLATLIQMIAIVVAGWGVLGMLNDQFSAAVTRFALAAILQLAMITMLLTDQRR